MERIGFVGVGFMSHGMAKNILAGGYPVSVIAHRNRAPVESLIGLGATEVTTLADMAAASDVVFICAPSSPDVEAIVAELHPGLASGAVIVDCSRQTRTVPSPWLARWQPAALISRMPAGVRCPAAISIRH